MGRNGAPARAGWAGVGEPYRLRPRELWRPHRELLPQVPLCMCMRVRVAPPLLWLPQLGGRCRRLQVGRAQRQAEALHRQHQLLVAVQKLLPSRGGAR